MAATGPFRLTRHPLSLAAPVVQWLNPRMTANYLAFNLVTTAHFVLGSLREESHLAANHGAAYRHYLRTGVPFYLPNPGTDPAPPAPDPAIFQHDRNRRSAAAY